MHWTFNFASLHRLPTLESELWLVHCISSGYEFFVVRARKKSKESNVKQIDPVDDLNQSSVKLGSEKGFYKRTMLFLLAEVEAMKIP